MPENIIARRKAALAKREAKVREGGGNPALDPSARRTRKLFKQAQRRAAKEKDRLARIQARAKKPEPAAAAPATPAVPATPAAPEAAPSPAPPA